VLKIKEFLQDGGLVWTKVVGWRLRDWNMVTRMPKIHGKGRTVEVLAFRHVVNKVQNHPGGFDERKSNNRVHRDIGTCGHE
jgi:hypothetical protein